MRLLYLITDLGPGGAERRLVMLANEAARRGHEVRVATAWEPGSFAALLDPRITLRQLGDAADRLPQRAASLWRELKAFRPRLYHGFMAGAKYGAVVARAAGVPAVLSSMVSAYGTTSRADRRRWRIFCAAAHRITVNSHGVWSFYAVECGVSAGKIELIPNFVPAAAYPVRDTDLRAAVRSELGLADQDFVVGHVGRCVPVKDHSAMLAAAARLRDEWPELRWLFVGDGPLEQELREQAVAREIGDRVIFAGHRDDVARVLQAMDVFCLPSRWEGMPNALLEAMASGLPAIGTAVAGSEELIQDGRTGWLIPVGDGAALVDALREAGAAPQRLFEMGRAARARVEFEYDQPLVIERYFQLYERLTGGAA